MGGYTNFLFRTNKSMYIYELGAMRGQPKGSEKFELKKLE